MEFNILFLGKILYEPVLNMKVVYFLYNLEYDVATSILYGILSDNDGGETVVSVHNFFKKIKKTKEKNIKYIKIIIFF